MSWSGVPLAGWLTALAVIASSPSALPQTVPGAWQTGRPDVSILVYHRFASTVQDSMTVRVSTFRSQLRHLNEHGYRIIPLRQLVTFLQHSSSAPPSPSVVLTVDDGHRSVFSDMLPIVQEQGIPVTLFIYPSAISNAPYAMTWPQLETLRDTGLFDIQSHTYWHPNFKVEKRRLSPAAYRAFAETQICRPRAVLRKRLGVEADLLAWPFGIYDEDLIELARGCGYVAGLSLDRRGVGPDDDLMSLPRLLVTDAAVGRAFASMLPRRER